MALEMHAPKPLCGAAGDCTSPLHLSGVHIAPTSQRSAHRPDTSNLPAATSWAAPLVEYHIYNLLYLCYVASVRKKKEQETATAALEEQPLYNRLAVLRTERGLSRRDLAEALKINYQTIGYIERGEYNPSLELAFRISKFFDLPIEAIFSREPFRPLSELIYGAMRKEQ